MSFFRPKEPLYVIGPLAHLPERVVDNEEMVQWMGTGRAGWIEKRSGIVRRHWVSESESCSDLALKAALRLKAEHNLDFKRVRQLVLSTVSGDYPTPPTAPLVQHRLGLENVGAFDVGAACAGFVTGLHISAGLTASTGEDHLLVSSEVRSKFLDPQDFATAVLFGDGAAAALVTTDPSGATYELCASQLFADGSIATAIHIAGGGSRLPYSRMENQNQCFLHMENSAGLFLKAAEGMSEALVQFLNRLEVPLEKIAWVVPHQANLFLIRDIARRLKIDGQKVFETVQYTGNTSGASVGIALGELKKRTSLLPGDPIALLSAGGGGLAACALLICR